MGLLETSPHNPLTVPGHISKQIKDIRLFWVTREAELYLGYLQSRTYGPQTLYWYVSSGFLAIAGPYAILEYQTRRFAMQVLLIWTDGSGSPMQEREFDSLPLESTLKEIDHGRVEVVRYSIGFQRLKPDGQWEFI